MKKAITLILFLFSLFGIAQNEPNDCVNSITVCGNENFVSGVSGSGNTQEVAACGGSEHNSLWLKINIAQSGTLGFNLVPSNPAISVDYDFWIYGPNVNCTALGSPIRCCTTNPTEAGLTSNITGMIGTTLVTQSGPGANGNGFVRWLDVVAGQSYYIAIDKPSTGNSDFEIQWTGTAMSGTGAFPIPPIANSISDYKVCSNVPNIGIFDLNTVRSSINSDLVDNEISFYTTFANAFDGSNELPNIISNTSNPQIVYAKVKNYTTDCYSITSFNLVVNPIPIATMSASSTSLCNGESVTISFNGPANSQVEYTINGGTTQQEILNSAGTFSFNQTPTSNTVYQFLNVKSLDSSNNVICTNVYNTSINVSVLPLPTASISGTTTICSENNATITFNGTPNAIVTYTIDSGSNQTIALDSSGNASINLIALSATVTYALVHVSYPTAPNCTTTLSGNAIITVVPILTASISGTTTICSGSTTTILFSGTPNAVVTYTVNSGSNQTITLDSTGNASLTTPSLTVNTVYALQSIQMVSAPTCPQSLTGSASITISAPPTASISGSTTICAGNTATILFTGTPNAIVGYTDNLGVSQTITLDASGNASLTTPVLNTTANYTLVTASFSGTPVCSQSISGSVTITVNPIPSVSISGSTSICSGATTTINFSGTPNAIVTYTINSGANQTIALDGTGNASIVTPVLTANSTYSLVDVALASSPACLQTMSGAAIITVLPLPTATISGTTTICSGSNTTILFTGTPNSVVNYTINSGTNQPITLDATGNASLTTGTLSVTTTYSLVNVGYAGTPICSQSLTGSAIVTIIPMPTVAISGTTSICSGSTTTISFTGTPNSVVTYTINASLNQTITLDASGNASFLTPALTSNTTYALVSVSTSTSPVCTQIVAGSALVTVIAIPTATISGTTTICSGNTTVISFSGTPNATITYTVNSGINQTILLNSSGNASLTTSVLTSNTTYSLVSIATTISPICSQTLSGSATITTTGLPTASISGSTTICSGSSATISFSGTPNATVTYNVNSGGNQTIILNASGVATLTTPLLTSNTSYNLVSVLFGCSQSLSGSALITVNPLPTVALTGTSSICFGTSGTITFTGTPNASVIYRVNGGANQTIMLNGSGSASITTPTLTSNNTYTLVSVSSSGMPSCTTILSGIFVINVVPVPTVIANPSNPVICSGQTTAISLSSNVGSGATFDWTISQVGVIGASAGSGNLIAQSLTTTGLIAGTVTYTIIASKNGCQGLPFTLTVNVNPKAVITASPSSQSICSGSSTSIVLSSDLNNTTYSWTATPTNVTGASNGVGSSIIQNLSAIGTTSGTVLYTITPTTNGCIGTVITVTITVSPKPNVTSTPNQETICSGGTTNLALSSTISGTTFSWTVIQNGVTGAASGTGSAITQTLITTGSTQGTVTYTVTPTNNGCLGVSQTIVVKVNPTPSVSGPLVTTICSGQSSNVILLSSLTGTTLNWSVVQTGVTGGSDGTGSIINQVLSTNGNAQGTAVYTITPTANGCVGTPLIVTVTVNPLPEVELLDGVICLNQIGNPLSSYLLDTGLTNLTHSFVWYFEGNVINDAIQGTHAATLSGNYGVVATNLVTGCPSLLATANVIESIAGQTITISQTEAFSDNPTIVVTVGGGNGVYEYQLDDGPFQLASIFTNVPFGNHIVTVRDTNGCTNLNKNILIIGYPKFFTPNGDGYNDTWNIFGITDKVNTKINVFDRYGKTIKTFKPNNQGWDGTYNGEQLPSTDYWFTVDYVEKGEKKVFKSHFSLKR